jgi:hypothetical protein
MDPDLLALLAQLCISNFSRDLLLIAVVPYICTCVSCQAFYSRICSKSIYGRKTVLGHVGSNVVYIVQFILSSVLLMCYSKQLPKSDLSLIRKNWVSWNAEVLNLQHADMSVCPTSLFNILGHPVWWKNTIINVVSTWQCTCRCEQLFSFLNN